MTMTNAEWMIKHGYKFSDLYACGEYDNDGNFIWHIRLSKADIEEISAEHDYANVITAWLYAEHKEQILDDAEKRYLSAVIKPFRKHVQNIAKYLTYGNTEEYIIIQIDSSERVNFPHFKVGTMYKGMKTGWRYTLEELGL